MSRNVATGYDNIHVKGMSSGFGGLEVDSFLRLWARGKKATAPSGRIPTSATGSVGISSYLKHGCAEEILDLAGNTSVTSVNNLLPANSIILHLVCTPVTDLTTPTTYNVGDGTTAARFGSALTNDDVTDGPQYARAHWTGTVAINQASAAKVKIIANAAGQGKIHVAVYYMQFLGGQL